MDEDGGANFRERYDSLLRAIAAGKHADFVEEAKIVRIRGADRPWTDTGIELEQGNQLSALAEGRLVLSEELDIWLPPRLYLWRRIGEKGPIFKAAHDTATHTAATAGRFFLAANPSQWTTPEGDYAGSDAELAVAQGAYDVLLIRWRGDPLRGLQILAQHAPGDPLLGSELERLQSPPVAKPRGWHYLWFVGESDVYSEEESAGRPVIRARVVNDAAILKKPVDAPLTPETRLLWRWRFRELPSRVAEDQLPTHDYLSIAVEFENGQDLTYYWSASLAPETSFRCPLPWWDQRETHLVVRSGPDRVGQWLAEERRIQPDYRAAVGEPPSRIVGVWLIAVSVFSHSRGVADFADIAVANGSERLQVH